LRQEQLLVVGEGFAALATAKHEPPPAVNKSTLGKLSLALALLAGAAMCFVKLSPRDDGENDKGFFYDLAEQKLFVAPRTLIPPIAGLKGGALTGVRAVVISTNANLGDKASQKIAYLEKYSSELKQVLEAVRVGKTSAVPTHQERQALIFVRRLNEAEWYTVKSPEGEKILTEWNVPGPDGRLPSVCSP
jgi:hypothetical protein